jgi:aminoglycoside phosphotransferase (APT) family kinase protein
MEGLREGTAGGHGPAEDAVGGLLDADSVLAYLSTRGLHPPALATVRPLGGGVSNVVLAVGEGPGALVVKQALAHLRVADVWPAPRDRAIAEAEALDLAGRLTPGAVPAVLDRDIDRCALVVERAPMEWEDWKSQLLSGRTDEAVAGWLGSLLSQWHNATIYGRALSDRLRQPERFDALRVDPYYRTVAQRRPEIAGAVLGYVDQMTARPLCLVHGDFSPKNVLVGDVLVGDRPDLWVIDFEVAHMGDPAFDVAFLLSHLMLKSVHRPALAGAYDKCALAFGSTYAAGVDLGLAPRWRYVLGHVGCLMLARVDGKSPVEYLTEDERSHARRFGELLLASPPSRLEDVSDLRRRSRP